MVAIGERGPDHHVKERSVNMPVRSQRLLNFGKASLSGVATKRERTKKKKKE